MCTSAETESITHVSSLPKGKLSPPGDSLCSTSVVTASWCYTLAHTHHRHTHRHTHTLFGYCFSLSSVPTHNGHTPNRILLLKVFSEGSTAFPAQRPLYYWCIIDVFFLFLHGLVVILREHNSNCSLWDLGSTGFMTLALQDSNRQSPVWETGGPCVGVKIACLPLLAGNLSSGVWRLTARLNATLRFPPAVPTHAYIRLWDHAAEKGTFCSAAVDVMWKMKRWHTHLRRLLLSHYSHQVSLNKIICWLSIRSVA